MAVTQTIRAAGLGSFYTLRDRVPETAPPLDDEWVRAADAAECAVTILDADRRDVALLLDGMRCGACGWLLETWLERQLGVEDASINFATRRARLRFNAKATSVATILRAIAKIGYRAYPYDPQRREALARKESRALLIRTSLALLGMMQVMMFAVPTYISVDGVDTEYQALLAWASLVLTLPVVLYSGAPFLAGAWRDVRSRRLGMDVPIAIGIAGAFAASVWATVRGVGALYFDSVTMFIALVLAARWLELRVRERAGDALEAVTREMPQVAQRLGAYPHSRIAESVASARLAPGDVVSIVAGTAIPADGEVLEGHSSVEEAVLTGESWPQPKRPGDPVLAGSINRESPLIVRVTAAGEATTLSALARLVERVAHERPRIARLSDRVAAGFVAALLVIATATGAIWSLIDPSRALPIALAVLVVSCPCALSLATPAALTAVAGALGRRQVLCVRPDALETLSRVTHVVLDKTGTLTTGDVRLVGVTPLAAFDPATCAALAAALESGSSHPIARALRAHARTTCSARDVIATPGCGVEGVLGGHRYRLGRPAWVAQTCAASIPAELRADATVDTLVVLADETHWIACLRFGDSLREGARALIDALRNDGRRISILSGDRGPAVSNVARMLDIADWRADATPDDKCAFIANLQRGGEVVAMIGDGLNDAPGLARADVSIAFGRTAALTQWTADTVVLGDDLARVAHALREARRAFRVIRQNLSWALAYNVVAIPLAVSGHLSPLAAAIGMSASSLVVVGNAWRLSRPATRNAGVGAPHRARPVGMPVAGLLR